MVRVVRPEHPVAAVAEDDAARRAVAYPSLRFGGPLFGHAEDLGDGRWCLRALWDDTPQAARDTLAHRFRECLAETTHPALAGDLGTVGWVLDWEKVDEVAVAGRRWRIARSDTFTRFGPDGPEPPRPSDPDSDPTGSAHPYSDREGVVVDPRAPVGPVQAMTMADLLSAYYPEAGVPANVYADSRTALPPIPTGWSWPPGTGWRNASTISGGRRAATAPLSGRRGRRSRSSSGTWFPVSGTTPTRRSPRTRRLPTRSTRPGHTRWTSSTAGFRVIRIETLLRFDPDGPKAPRLSDHDPEPPPEAHFAQLRQQGQLPEPE